MMLTFSQTLATCMIPSLIEGNLPTVFARESADLSGGTIIPPLINRMLIKKAGPGLGPGPRNILPFQA